MITINELALTVEHLLVGSPNIVFRPILQFFLLRFTANDSFKEVQLDIFPPFIAFQSI
jgi:hypothetical protein